jgi:hypothetical protein
MLDNGTTPHWAMHTAHSYLLIVEIKSIYVTS